MTARALASAAAAVLVLGCVGCASNSVDNPVPLAAEACRPLEANGLGDDFSAAELAGAWSLWMFADEGDATGAAAGGRLELAAWEAGDEPLVGGSPPALYGATDVDVSAVGAVDTGDPSSRALERPGVLVLQWREPGDERPNVAMRLGARSNRLDRMTFDDAYTALRVYEARDTAFAGQWESGAGRGPVAGGRFCAVRASPPESGLL